MKIEVNWKRYGLYLLRWQLSTPLIASIMYLFSGSDYLLTTVFANFVGGLIFFWVDKFIFMSQRLSSQWEVRENVVCADCGRVARGYRLVLSENYDKTRDPYPKFRCEACSERKSQKLKNDGIKF